MSESIKIRKAGGTWVVRAGGAVLGESSDVLEVDESGDTARIYFPRGDLAMAFLEPSDMSTRTPGLGEAKHYSIVTKSTVLKDAAWSYEDPEPDAERIKGHIAFRTGDTVTVEQL